MKNNKILYFIFLSIFIHGIIYFSFDNKKQNKLFLKQKNDLFINFRQKILTKEKIHEKEQLKKQKEVNVKKEQPKIENKNILTEEKDINLDLFNDYIFNYKKVIFIMDKEKNIVLISIDDKSIEDDSFKLYLENKLKFIDDFPIDTEIELLLYPTEKIKLVE